MSDSDQEDIGKTGTKPVVAHETPANSVHLYPDSGIRERQGNVPLWLWLVVLALSIWGIYYLVTFWNPPPGSA